MRSRRERVDDASRLYYQSCAYSKVCWRGYQALLYPTDAFVLADLLHRVRPQVVVETGTFMGGTALFLAEQMEPDGLVITIDTTDWSGVDGYPTDPRISYVRGPSTDHSLFGRVADDVAGRTCLVLLDSDHRADHVAAELDLYATLVTLGSYLVVGDTNVHQVRNDYPPGPDDALAKWLPDHPEFAVDRDCERLVLTANPGGWLRRVA